MTEQAAARAACEAFWAMRPHGDGPDPERAWNWARQMGAGDAWEAAVLAGVDALLAQPGPQLAGVSAALEIARLRAAAEQRNQFAAECARLREEAASLREQLAQARQRSAGYETALVSIRSHARYFDHKGEVNMATEALEGGG